MYLSEQFAREIISNMSETRRVQRSSPCLQTWQSSRLNRRAAAARDPAVLLGHWFIDSATFRKLKVTVALRALHSRFPRLHVRPKRLQRRRPSVFRRRFLISSPFPRPSRKRYVRNNAQTLPKQAPFAASYFDGSHFFTPTFELFCLRYLKLALLISFQGHGICPC